MTTMCNTTKISRDSLINEVETYNFETEEVTTYVQNISTTLIFEEDWHIKRDKFLLGKKL